MAELFQLDLPNREHAVAVAQAACLAAADRLGLAPEKRARLELVVEEVVVNSVHHAYPANELGVIRVSARVDGAVFSVQVQDWGLPFDPTEAVPYSVEDPDLRGLGLHLAWKSCDEAEFRNLGRQGKRFDLRFRLPGQPLTVLEAPEDIAPAADGKAARRSQIDLRPFRPVDAPGVARCAWLAYGYTKPDDHLYDPPELVRRNADGLMASVVALDESGTVVGHSCLDFSSLPHAPEATDLVVAPVARGNPILVQRLLQALNDIARERGCLGALANAVTAHTVSQRGALRFGGVPIHVHLASVSTEWELTPGSSGGGAVRQSEVAFYIPFHPGPPRTVYAPARHRDVIADILTATGEPVTLADPAAVAIPDQPTELTVESGLLAWGHVLMTVKVYGRDAVAVIAGFLRRFCADGVATVLLELPLGDPATAVMADSIERLGFSIAGVFPNAPEPGGDTLIYQYLNNVIPDLAGERIATACRPLYDHVVAERRRIDREVFGASFPDTVPQEPTP
ncbi:ATP-binding protein [Azospirillum griseum]|uniref:ATP-binding protein n=1 Tax=Azospirillum griseum TaxID=2496639 RepID=A0A3S0JLG7_9PROT|nr:ATP-binding protein [Azospirillum griseum]RTR23698.1 ATP-binding protein [Azospirillum griseum]